MNSRGLPAGFHELRRYNHEFDGEGVRLFTADKFGREFFAVLEAGHGKAYVQRRDKAIAAIEAAMAARDPRPGCVGIWVSPATLAVCKKVAPETYGPASEAAATS